jgi:hypothetical protein
MSWFDTKQLTSLAKSALSEAQKTLDKALDIKEDGGGAVENVPVESAMSASKMWGSFTGSFFDSSQVAASSEGSGW